MPKEPNQKLKLLYLMKILLEKTDENHGLTMSELLLSLEAYGISSERKSIYSDIESLRQYGMDIIGEKQDKSYRYYVGKREFELAELKLLVDSVQAAKFITAKKSGELIKKIENLTSKHEAGKLHRQVYVAERIKTINENIYYNVDVLHTAIATNVKITFQYFQWNVQKEMVLKRCGERYAVSPWALSWDDDNYYLIAFDHREDKIKHFRVDKMLNIELSAEQREGRESFGGFDIAQYNRKMFGMFGGEEEMVTLECVNELAGVIIDRFGKEITLHKKGSTHFTIKVKVAVSRQFLSWVMALGEGIRILSPDSVVEGIREEIKRLAKQYERRE
ncbi:MAG: WYL domain-containing protein [Lachnospiraceae bacterium]|nr:WYL domain-containing protein [Lachnospiraceae bacterium]